MPEMQIFAFRGSDDGQDHVALLVGAFRGRPPLVRLHSECLTGDVFGSLKCDCGPQLHEALRLIGDAGGGVLLYLRQEGRGIGLANKLRAYALQDRGLDTVDANLRLGFADDERDYAHAAAILRKLGIGEVRLLTNNPRKVGALEREGIKVAERVAHHMPANPHNADYLAVKRAKSGHLP
jgi:GTP cyclohydrolase II